MAHVALACAAAMTALLFVLSGCGLAATIETNTRAIEGTTRAIQESNAALRESNLVLRDVQKTSEALTALEEPMEKVAALQGSLEAVAELEEPLRGVQAGLADLAALKESMDRLREMRTELERVAALSEPMAELRQGLEDVREPMKDVATLKKPMEDVALLHRPMEDVAKLYGPMAELARLGAVVSGDRSLLIGALLGWGLVTFLAVYLGARVGSRRSRRPLGGHRHGRAHRRRAVLSASPRQEIRAVRFSRAAHES